jgi:tyrosine-specific transport protein
MAPFICHARVQDAGFVPSSAALLGCYAFSALTGLMIMEVNINTVCELGAGAISMQSMVKRTLGSGGAAVASGAYVFLHYVLLVAYIARASGSVANTAHQPMWIAAAAFSVATGGLCYFSTSKVLDKVNTAFLAVLVLAFLGLVGLAVPGVEPDYLSRASWPSVIGTLPVVALAFVYQNIVPVIVSNLEGDIPRTRTAVLAGLAVPLLMFLGWEAAILGSLPPGARPDALSSAS